MDDINNNVNVISEVDSTLKELEDDVIKVEDASKSNQSEPLSSTLPHRLSTLFSSISSLPSRNHAEQLLSIGVSFWNAVNAFEGKQYNKTMYVTLTKIKHIAVKCMHFGQVTLKGVSERYDITNLTLLRFFCTCAQKYMKDCDDFECAEECFSTATELSKRLGRRQGSGGGNNNKNNDEINRRKISKAVFDLCIGHAECFWMRDETEEAERLISEARTYLTDLPGEFEYLSSIEYNFGMYLYERNETKSSLHWLYRSIETRGNKMNASRMNVEKQAATMRLAGVCLLALRRYEESWKLMNEAESLAHDSTGVYLLLKLSIITKKTSSLPPSSLSPSSPSSPSPLSLQQFLISVAQDERNELIVCMGCIALFTNANLLGDAVEGYRHLFQRFRNDSHAIVKTIAPRFFECLVSVGEVKEALEILQLVCDLIPQEKEKENNIKNINFNAESERNDNDNDDDANKTNNDHNSNINGNDNDNDEEMYFSQWATMCLTAGCTHADRNEFQSAALFLHHALKIGCERLRMCGHTQQKNQNENENEKQSKFSTQNVIQKNEGMISRLLSSCALCVLEERDPTQRRKSLDTTKRKEFIQLAVTHALRAHELDKTDFTSRLLLFRAHVASDDFSAAAFVLKDVAGTTEFDIGALAEAACVARDARSMNAVINVLKCIVHLDEDVLQYAGKQMKFEKGFYGTLLVSCVGIMVSELERTRSEKEEHGDDESGESQNCYGENKRELELNRDLLHVLQAGVRGLKKLGAECALKEDSNGNDNNDKGMMEIVTVDEKLEYLSHIAWNEGMKSVSKAKKRRRTTKLQTQTQKRNGNEEYDDESNENMGMFFDVCHAFCLFRTATTDVLRTRLMCKVLCASAAIEQHSDFEMGREHLTNVRDEARLLEQMMMTMTSTGEVVEEEEIKKILLILDAKCCVGCNDENGLMKTVESAMRACNEVDCLEQLGNICHTWDTSNDDDKKNSEVTKLNMWGLTTMLMGKAVKLRLSENSNDVDIDKVAQTMREMIGVELKRNDCSSRALQTFIKAVDIATDRKYGDRFKRVERQWLIGIGWERAQLLVGVGRKAEGKQWGEQVLQVVKREENESLGKEIEKFCNSL